MDYIERPNYLQKLIDRKDNGEIKIITGPRRSGKSWLLSKLYYRWLVDSGVPSQNIISLSFDLDDDKNDIALLDSVELKKYLYERILNKEHFYYVFLDEIQEVDNFERIVNGLATKENVDVYITGSNSKFLSSDIKTIFRGRGDEVKVFPFSYKEFCSAYPDTDMRDLWKEYYTFGGLPGLLNHKTPIQKTSYLQRLWKKTYIDDVIERNNIRNKVALEALVNSLCSSVGSLTNPSKISKTLKTIQNIDVSDDTIGDYITALENAYLFEGVQRYNIKGKRYYESIKKYYAIDIGLRNARLNYRQMEMTHIMENIIYNELRMRDYLVDIGIVEYRRKVNDRNEYVQLEVDFIATNGAEKYYIQSAYAIPDEEKRKQETDSLRHIDDSFQKIVIIGEDIVKYTDDNGIIYMGLFQFLMNDAVL